MPEAGRGGIAPASSRSGGSRESYDGLATSLSASEAVATAIAVSRKEKGDVSDRGRGEEVREDEMARETEVEKKRKEIEKEEKGKKERSEKEKEKEDCPMKVTIDDSSEEDSGNKGIEGKEAEEFALRTSNEMEEKLLVHIVRTNTAKIRADPGGFAYAQLEKIAKEVLTGTSDIDDIESEFVTRTNVIYTIIYNIEMERKKLSSENHQLQLKYEEKVAQEEKIRGELNLLKKKEEKKEIRVKTQIEERTREDRGRKSVEQELEEVKNRLRRLED